MKTAAERYDAAKRRTLARLVAGLVRGDDNTARIWREECIAAIEAAVSEERARTWRTAVQRCTAEITGIWGADLVTTQAALNDLLECRIGDGP